MFWCVEKLHTLKKQQISTLLDESAVSLHFSECVGTVYLQDPTCSKAASDMKLKKTWFANLQLIIKRACQGARLPQHVFNITSEKVIAGFSGKGVPERVQ